MTIAEPAQSVLSSWIGRPEPEIFGLTELEKFGRATPNQQRALSLQMMRSASQVAQYVALRKLGNEDARLMDGDVVVAELVCLEAEGDECTQYAPAADSLEPGDTITSVDGEPVATVDALVEQLADKQPGDVVTLEIEREGEGASTIEVPLIASPDDPERTIIGFVPFDTATVELPFEIEIDTDRIGGPSAGLAFTLTLIDELSEGNLLGGLDVAVTGTIDIDGNVGAIGGLPQKVSAVKQAGVDHFLVPASQSPESLEQARLVAGDDVEIIPVATLDEALAVLERLGGDRASLIAAFAPTPRFTLDAWPSPFSRPDPSSPAAVSEATFNTGRRGFDQQEVRDFLRMVAAELARLQERERFLERELRDLQQRLPSASGEAIIDDETATRLIGEEATRILQTAREGANAIRAKGEEGAARLLREAADDAQRQREEADLEASRRRSDAAADAEAELAMAKQQGREMVEEARCVPGACAR